MKNNILKYIAIIIAIALLMWWLLIAENENALSLGEEDIELDEAASN